MHREKWGMKRKHLGHVQAACDLVKCPFQRCLPAATGTAAADTDPGWGFSLQNISCFLEKEPCVCREIFIKIFPECLQQGCAGAAGVLKLLGDRVVVAEGCGQGLRDVGDRELGAEGCGQCFWQGRFGASPDAEGSPAGQSPEKSSVRYF